MLESGGQKNLSSTVQQEVDRSNFSDTIKALKSLKCSEDDVKQIWILLACVLHMSNITYTDPTNNITSTIRSASQVGKVDPQRPVEISCSTLDIDVLASLLGCPSIEGFIQAVVTQRIKIPGRSSIRLKLLSVIQCQNNITSLIKWIYSQLFGWLVKKINLALASNELDLQGFKRVFNNNSNKDDDSAFIGILDIFGFEILSINSFEQLCINLTNERLQQCFNETVFIMEQDMYKQEGLNWHEIQFHNNQPVIDLITNKRKDLPLGLLNIIEEFSKLNRRPDDLQLLNSFHQYHESSLTSPTSKNNRRLSMELSSNVLYARSRKVQNGFVIRHFAGDVHYTITGFLEKNNDSLQTDLLLLLSCSTNDFLRTALDVDEQLSSTASSTVASSSHSVRKSSINNKVVEDLKKLSLQPASSPSSPSTTTTTTNTTTTSSSSVSTQFRNQLDVLLSTLSSTAQHYVKCIKPNSNKTPKEFNARLVTEQLKYNGVLEIVRIRRDGYSIRLPFIEFYQTYEVILLVATSDGEDVELNQSIPSNVRLLRGTASKLSSSPRDVMIARICTAFIAKNSLQASDYQIGKSLIFLKDTCLSTLQAKLRMIFNLTSIIIQARVRAYIISKKYRKIISKFILLQSWIRQVMSRLKYLRFCSSIVKLQSKIRSFLCQRLYKFYLHSIVLLQSCIRRFLFRIRRRIAQMMIEQQKEEARIAFIAWKTIKIQAWIRMTILSKRYRHIQMIRREEWLRQQKLLYEFKHKSCLLIQRNYRITLLLKKRLKLIKNNVELFILQQKSSIEIQRIVRGLLCRSYVGRYIRSMHVIVQQLYNFIIRRRYLKIRNYRQFRIHFLQAWMRMMVVRKLYRKQLQSIRSIQYFMRSKKLRLQYLKSLSAILQIQSVVRGFISRRRVFNRIQRWKEHILSSKRKIFVFIYRCHRNMVSCSINLSFYLTFIYQLIYQICIDMLDTYTYIYSY